MRIRSLKPAFFKNETLAELPAHARLLFQGLWLLADCQGRLPDRPKRIRAEVFPYEDVDVHGLLAQLNNAGFIVRYEVDGINYLEVTGFRKHQRISGKEAETPSDIPPVPTWEAVEKQSGLVREASWADRANDLDGTSVAKTATADPVFPTASPSLPDRFTIALEGKGKEGKGEGSAPLSPRVDENDPHGRWTYERLQPWAKALKAIPGIRGLDADGWQAWRTVVDRFGAPAVVAAAMALEPRVRFADRVETYLVENPPLTKAPSDPLDDAIADAIHAHGWERCFTAAGFDAAQIARLPEHARKTEQTPAAAAREILRGNRPAARAMLAKLSGAAASGAA